MEQAEHLEHLRREADAFYAAVGELAARVPSCPEWSVADLVHHVGQVHRFWSAVAERGVTDRAGARALERPDRPADPELVAWARANTEHLLEVLAALAPDAPRWNWSQAPHEGRWIVRRMAHETAVHRWDAQRVAGEPDRIDAALAADGIDEFLTVFVPADEGYAGPEAVIRLETTDVGRAWTVALGAPSPVVVTDAEPDTTIQEPAHDLLLALWGREDAPEPLLKALVDFTDRD